MTASEAGRIMISGGGGGIIVSDMIQLFEEQDVVSDVPLTANYHAVFKWLPEDLIGIYNTEHSFSINNDSYYIYTEYSYGRCFMWGYYEGDELLYADYPAKERLSIKGWAWDYETNMKHLSSIQTYTNTYNMSAYLDQRFFYGYRVYYPFKQENHTVGYDRTRAVIQDTVLRLTTFIKASLILCRMLY